MNDNRDTIRQSLDDTSMLGFRLACGLIQVHSDRDPTRSTKECIDMAFAEYMEHEV